MDKIGFCGYELGEDISLKTFQLPTLYIVGVRTFDLNPLYLFWERDIF
jgi:hypothetical protein